MLEEPPPVSPVDGYILFMKTFEFVWSSERRADIMKNE